MAYHHDRAPIKNTTKETNHVNPTGSLDTVHRNVDPPGIRPRVHIREFVAGSDAMTNDAQTGTKDKPFYLKSGEMSRYGLACGYIEKTQLAPDCVVEMFMEHGHYHVHSFSMWEVFDKLTPARKFYRKTIRECRP